MSETVRYRGVIAERDYGESMDALFLDSDDMDSGEPLAERISDDMDLGGQYLSVRYWTASEPRSDDDIREGAVLAYLGAGDVQFSPHYSDITGYLWTDEDINVGGHDLLAELRSQKGRYCLLEIDYAPSPVSQTGDTETKEN
jgi:hypothetical protein